MSEQTATCLTCTHFEVDESKLPVNYHNSDEPINAEGTCTGYLEPEYRCMNEVCGRHSYKGIGESPIVQLQLSL